MSAGPARGPRRALHLVVAGATFVLAALGVVLPLLPTTPFLLVTSYCLLRASPRLHRRLVSSRVFGPFLRDWQRYHGVRPHVKITAVAMILLAVGASLWSGALSWTGVGVLLVAAAIGLVVVLRLPVIRDPAA